MAPDVSQASRQTVTEYDCVSDEKSDVSQEHAESSTGSAGVTRLTTIHEAELASGPSGAVEYGVEIEEVAAVARRSRGEDIVVHGDDTSANRSLAFKIEAQVGVPSRPQFLHTSTAGPMALPHFHQKSRSPGGHTFYETERRKARKKP
jgi:hypothetical protein